MMTGLTPPASAQSAKDDRIRAVLAGQQEFVETLAEITPQVLRLQKELVEKLKASLDFAKQALESGTVQGHNFTDLEQTYYRELEALEVMSARAKDKSLSANEILKIKIRVRSEAVEDLKQSVAALRQQVSEGVVGIDAVGAAEARALKAEIVLIAMKQAAGE